MLNLTLNETRVLGVLFEKERTTPDQYPLSLNSLMNGCNQKSNREPVLNFDEGTLQDIVDILVTKGLVAEVTLSGRVSKYRQRLGNTQFSELQISLKEHSLLCVLFLRGPQTPGELRTRTQRLCDFTDVQEVEETLQNLIDRPGDPYVARLPREPGKRESRYAHTFSGEVTLENDHSTRSVANTGNNADKVDSHATSKNHIPTNTNDDQHERILALEQQVADMQTDINELKRQWRELNGE